MHIIYACVYKGIVETSMFLTKTNNGSIQTISISFQNILMKPERNNERKYSMQVMLS